MAKMFLKGSTSLTKRHNLSNKSFDKVNAISWLNPRLSLIYSKSNHNNQYQELKTNEIMFFSFTKKLVFMH